MNFTGMQDRLRQELLRRIRRGTVSVSLLARQTGFCEAHVSNFLRARRQLSLEGVDRMLSAQRIDPMDLLRNADHGGRWEDELSHVPVVSAATAMFEPQIRAVATLSVLQAPAAMLESARPRTTQQRRPWARFVAVSISEGDAAAMSPVLQPNAVVLIDRHYTSLNAYRRNRENLYAVRDVARLAIRYLDFKSERLLLRPHSLSWPVQLVDLAPAESLLDVIVGRVVMILNEV
jgi:hypothetical protein